MIYNYYVEKSALHVYVKMKKYTIYQFLFKK